MLGFMMDCFVYKNTRIETEKESINFAVNNFSNTDIENLFNFIKNSNGRVRAYFPVSDPLLDEFDPDLTHSYSLEMDKKLTLEKFIDSFYLAKLFSNFIFDDDSETNISLTALSKKFNDIANAIPSKKTCEELLFDALNDYDIWSTEFYRDFASFEQFIRYHAITGDEFRVWFDDYYIIFHIGRYKLSHSIRDTLIQNIIYVIKEHLLMFDSDGLDDDWECIDLEIALYENNKITKVIFKEHSIYEIAKTLFEYHNKAVILGLCSVRFKYDDEPISSNMSCTC